MQHLDRQFDSPLVALRRRWWLGAVLAILGAVEGVALAGTRPTEITAEVRVVVGSEELSAYQVPGYAAASVQLADNYSRYIGVQVEAGRLKSILPDVSGVHEVSASPIPDSAVIRLEATAESAATARRAADDVGTFLVKTVNDAASSDATSTQVLNQFSTASRRASQTAAAKLVASSQLERLVTTGAPPPVVAAARRTYAQAAGADATAQLKATTLASKYTQAAGPLSGSSTLRIITPAVVTNDDRRSMQQQYGFAGVLVGLFTAMLLSMGLDRSRRILRART